jgi:hypothetical protein
MARNYQPTLRALLHSVAIFIARWRVLILAGMTPQQAAALATFEVGLRDLQEQLGVDPVDP